MRRLIAEPFSVTILVPQIEDKIVNKNNILKETYFSDIQHEYETNNLDYAETLLARKGKRLVKPYVEQFIQGLRNGRLITSDTDEVIKDNDIIDDNEVDDIDDIDDIESEININDLPIIIWKDKEYSVVFKDNNTCELINEYGNYVLTLDNVSDLDDVNDQLANEDIITDSDMKEMKKQQNDYNNEVVKESNIKTAKAQDYAHTYNQIDDYSYLIDEYIEDSREQSDLKIQEDNDFDITQRENPYYSLLLQDSDLERFKMNICPICDCDSLEITEQENNKWYVVCNDCGNKFMIDTVTGDVWYSDDIEDLRSE